MDIGRLDRRIRIERKTLTTDADYGTPIETWETFAVIFANWQDVLPSKGENVVANILTARRLVRVRIRFMLGVTSDMRVKLCWGSTAWGSRHWWTDTEFYEIVGGPAEMGRREGLELMVALSSTDGHAA